MSQEEAALWNQVAPPNAEKMSRELMHSVFVGGGGYRSKWFSFDRPYLFGRQAINQPGGREGQEVLMVIPLRFEVKDTLIKKLLPDTNLNGVSEELRDGSCRCKVEGKTITIGISLPVLERIAQNMTIQHLGGRLTPP